VRPFATATPPIVRFDGVSQKYGSRLALDQVDLAIHPGEFAFIVGTSGAGKSTLLKLINREVRPTSGRLWVAGMPAHELKASRVAGLRRRVGVVFQDYKLLPRLNALENVAFGLQVADLTVSDGEARERAMDALDAVGLGGREDAFPSQLSGGQQQRVAIARAVVAQPALLIADEPTGNLDQENAWEIMRLFEDIAAGGTAVLVATHNLEIVTRMGHRVITLIHGRLTEDQPAAQREATWLASL